MTKNAWILERKLLVIAKNLLYDANPDLIIQESPVEMYDLLARFEHNPSIQFWIEVKSHKANVTKNLKGYLKNAAFNISLKDIFAQPIILILVGNTKDEPAEFCILTKHHKGPKSSLIIKDVNEIKFKSADIRSLSEAIDEIVRWHKEQTLVS